jgi:DNA polymerase-1
MAKLILIDGSAVAYRSFFAFIRNPLINSHGENTGAVFGFVSSLMRILNEHKPDYIVVTFDTPAPTFRHALHKDYKSTRVKMPSELVEQLPWIDQAIDGFNIKVIRMEGFEADDIIGTLAAKAEKKGIETLIFSGDKDFFQLVDNDIKILHPKDFSILDSKGVKEKFGVPPEKVIDTLALMGETSDNIPGIPGVGPKTAIALIEEFGSLEKVLQSGPNEKKGRLAGLLSEHKDQALLSQDLVTIRKNVPVDLDLKAFAVPKPNPEALIPFFRRMEFKSLVDKFAIPVAEKLSLEESRASNADYKTVANLDNLNRLLAEFEKKREVIIDTETTSLVAVDARLVGISLSAKEGEAYYVPVGHVFGDNLPLDKVLELFDKFFKSDIKIIGQNTKYDRQVFKNHNVTFTPDFDTMIAAYLLNPGKRGYGLDSLSLEYFNYHKIPTTDLIGKGRKQINFSQVPIEKASVYSCEDADFTLRLKNFLEPQIKKLELLPLMMDIEMPLVPVLGDMEADGVKIDIEFLGELSKDYGRKMRAVEKKIYERAGREFNINSSQQLGAILFDVLKLSSSRRTAKGGARATSVDVLLKLAEDHPLPRLILEYRQLMKLKSTYIDALPVLVNSRTGRVHTTFNQTIAATGRLSSTDPNLQNIPIRTEEGREIRRAFIPGGKEYKILSADYSQIDLRVLAHISDDEAMIQAFKNGEDIHRRTASEVYGVKSENVTSEQRRAAKVANFAIVYGATAYGLSQQSELTLSESKDFMETYFERHSGIKKYMENIKKEARAKGYVATLFNRRRYLPDINAKSVQARQFAERIAINMPIQGTAADMIKIAMINIAKKMKNLKSKMILQVHDELVFDAHKNEIRELTAMVKQEMEGAVKLSVPIRVDVALGDNWLEAK